MSRPARILPAPFLLVALLLAGCGPEAERTPSACLGGAEVFLEAASTAPERALLADRTPISDCLVKDQPAGDLNTVGQALIVAATRLNAEAGEDPAGKASTQLGYLVGSAEAGAADTGGIHADLIRRLSTAARFSEGGAGLGAEFELAFEAGRAAARESG